MKLSKEKENQIISDVPILMKQKKSTKEMALILNIGESTLRRRLKLMNISVPNYHNMLKFDNTVFDIIDLEEKAYWLGFLYADWNVNKNNNQIRVNLSAKDKDHIEKYNNFLKNVNSIRDYIVKTNGKEYNICDVTVCDKHFKERLIELGCIPQKSLKLIFPNLNIFKQQNLVYDFIRGYIDGDGCITYSRNGRLQIEILGTKEFLTGILNIFPEKFTLHKIKRLESNTFVLRNCGKNADYIANKLYGKATIYMQRKFNRFVVLSRDR